jgi:hypothetical protein
VLAAVTAITAVASDATILKDLVSEGLFVDAPDALIHRMDLDMTGDGRKEIFVAGSTSQAGLDWVIYCALPEGSYRRLGVVTFSPKAFAFDARSGLLVHYQRVGAGVGGYVWYQVDSKGLHTLDRIADAEAARRVRNWNDRPRVWSTTMRALRAGDPVDWQDSEAASTTHRLSALRERVRD